ncbi:MAG: dihydropteroate synthase [Verrucomicrobiota bacterium]
MASKEKEKVTWSVAGKEWDLSERGWVMGVLNVTPDSFSDGGRWMEVEEAVSRGLRMGEEGAAIVDVGGESTRPGAEPVTLAEELERVLPVVEALSKRWDGMISIDTSKAEVAARALEVGATIVNDITGLRDEAMVEVCAGSDCGVVVMHMQGQPKTMQERPQYADVVGEVRGFFEERLATLEAAGIGRERLCWDPGIGFGKRLEDNTALLRHLPEFAVGGCPVMVGVSRKSFIGKLLEESEMEVRDWPTVGLTAWTREGGARVHRVHDVKANVEAMRMVEAF